MKEKIQSIIQDMYETLEINKFLNSTTFEPIPDLQLELYRETYNDRNSPLIFLVGIRSSRGILYTDLLFNLSSLSEEDKVEIVNYCCSLITLYGVDKAISKLEEKYKEYKEK